MQDYFDSYKSSNFIEEWWKKDSSILHDIQKCLKFNKVQPFFN